MKLIQLFIFLVFASPSVKAHEESCSFKALLKNVVASSKRSPQADSVILVADVEVKAAQSAKGTLSYLDCKHWENQNLVAVEVVASQMDHTKQLQKVLVELEFRRRKTPSGIISSWRLATK